MPLLTISIASILTLLGLGSYYGLGRTSITALIPAFFGLPLLGMGCIALYSDRRRHAMHAASALVLLGFLGTVRGLVLVPMLAARGREIQPRFIAQAIMAVLCGILLTAYTKSFLDARRRRSRTARPEDNIETAA